MKEKEVILEERMSTIQAANYAGVHPVTILYWIYQNKLPAIKVDGKWKISTKDMDDWLATRSERAASRRREK